MAGKGKVDLLDRTLALLQKKFGAQSAVRLGEGRAQAAAQIREVIPTGVEALDFYGLGIGGLPVGRVSEVYGAEGCLAGDTFVHYEVRRPDGTRVNSKGGTLARLFERFHGVADRRGAPLRDVEFWAPSMNDEGCIVQNRVLDVVDSGVRECFVLVTRGGARVVATADHEFFTGLGYTRLDALRVGVDHVYVHGNTPRRLFNSDHGTGPRLQIYVRHHPVAGDKVVAGRYRYKRLARARAVAEAALNGLDLHEYVARLNRGDLRGLDFLSRDEHVHHIDEDFRNDALENLVVVRGAEHNRHHALENHNNLRFEVHNDIVDAIVPAGPLRTFDVKMADPLRNVVAGGVVAHNCGKTSLGYACMASAQRVGGTAMVLDSEYSFDEDRARVFGVDVNDLVVMQPVHMEMGLEQMKLVLGAHDPKAGPLLLVYDTVAASVPKSFLGQEAGERAVGEIARLMSTELPKIVPLLTKHRAHLLLLNQVRTKIGVMFGDNTTTPGGNAVKFYASWRAQFFGGKAVKDADGQHTGKVVTIISVKTRFTPPWRKVRARLDYAAGFNNEWTTLEHAKGTGAAPRAAKGKKAHAAALAKLGWAPSVTVVGQEAARDEEE